MSAAEAVRALLLGLLDGCRQPVELTTGISYVDPDLSEAYDRGVNLGQAIGLVVYRLHDTTRVIASFGTREPRS